MVWCRLLEVVVRIVCESLRVNAGPSFLCPLARRSVPYPIACVAIGGPPPQREPSRVLGGRSNGRRHTATSDTLRDHPVSAEEPAPRALTATTHVFRTGATTAACPGAMSSRPVTSAPASVAMIQPAARSHGLRPTRSRRRPCHARRRTDPVPHCRLVGCPGSRQIAPSTWPWRCAPPAGSRSRSPPATAGARRRC
jgi:hypothetical protein